MDPQAHEASLQRLREQRSPNEPLVDQYGRTLRLYDDVVRNRILVIGVTYTLCTNTCSPALQNLMEARRLLGAQGRALRFVSMTLTPLTDTPPVLREFHKRQKLDDDWLLLTGRPERVERVQRAMGFLSRDPEDDLLSHSTMARLCDDRYLRWTHLNTQLSGAAIARMIRFELV